MSSDPIIVSTISDDPLAADVAQYMGQTEEDISDIISIKNFANTEFCPRFMVGNSDFRPGHDGKPGVYVRDISQVGDSLRDRIVFIVSTCSGSITRNARAMRTFLVARAAKDNGAKAVVLVEPDLFYSAQDRGPRVEHGNPARSDLDRRKFDGQAFSSLLYCQLLNTAGVDCVLTVHNHSEAVAANFERNLTSTVFKRHFYNLIPSDLYAEFLIEHNILSHSNMDRGFVLCAPDKGAEPFVTQVFRSLQSRCDKCRTAENGCPAPDLLLMGKNRTGERSVDITIREDSPTALDAIRGRDVIVFDDMVRTGHTIAECCRYLKENGAARVLFMVTHFYSSPEVKDNLNDGAIDEIITTNTLPNILNRDMQGRLRHKMVILKIERWIANALNKDVLGNDKPCCSPAYTIDVSRKNPRWADLQKDI